MNYINTIMSLNDDFNSWVSSFDFLDEYSEYFEKIDILWEWNYWVVVDWWYEKVYKLWRNIDFSNSLRKEYYNHLKFYMWLEELKSIDWNKDKYKNFRVPEVARSPELVSWKISWEELFIYEMEKIKWHNLLSYLIKEELEKEWIQINLDMISDREAEDLYTKHIWKSINALRNWLLIDMTNQDRKFMKKVQKWAQKWVWNSFPSLLFSKYFPDLYDQIADAIFDLKKMWYKHTDLHAKNIMISYEAWEPYIYLIDFWIVDIKKWI